MSGHHPSASGASRAPAGADSFTTISPFYETREIKVAYGIEAHPTDNGYLQTYLNDNLEISDDLEKISATEYINHLQGVRFLIEETISKQKFIEWLKMPEIHLFYSGHARFGRGPCFSAHEDAAPVEGQPFKTEDWEQGTDGASGIFRMGYPFIGIEVSELITHGYTANPMKESEGRPARADCEPAMRGYLSSLRARAPAEIDPGLAAQLRDNQDGDRYWSYPSPRGMAVVHHAGWRNTLSTGSDLGTIHDPDDADNTQMLCRVLVHAGCSTLDHNHAVLRHIARWQRTGNERYAFWTTNTSNAMSIGPWMHALISYDQWNAFSSWEPSLAWTVQRTNNYLRRHGQTFRMI